MTTDSTCTAAATAWCGRLLLFAALLLGIVTMHSFGHPAAHGDDLHAPPAVVTGHVAGPAAAPLPPSDDGHGMPMNPTSVCLAVLGGAAVGLLGALTSLATRSRRARVAPPGLLARWLPRLATGPPPSAGRTLLSRLSVLRV